MESLARISLGALALAVLFAASQPAEAQFSGDGLRPLTGTVVLTGQAGTEPPPGAEQIGITLSGVTLNNALPEMEEANEAYVARLTGGRIPLSEVFDATADLQAAYREAGYVLVQIILPRQNLRNGGQLRTDVRRGVVEAVNSAGTPGPIRSRVEELTGPLVGDPALSRGELERRLILASEIPGTALDVGLQPGSRPGAVVVELDPTFEPVTGFVGYDNSLSDLLGRDNLNAGVELNSFLGRGETIYGRLSGSPSRLLASDPKSRTFSIGALMPVGSSGAAVGLDWTQSDGYLSAGFDWYFISKYDRLSARFLYPLVRNQKTRLTGQVSLDMIEDTGYEGFVGCCEFPLFRDKFTVLRFGVSGSHNHDDGAVTEGGLTVSRGINAFGAVTMDEVMFPGFSRFGADAEFTKLNAALSHRRQLNDRLTLSLGGRLQTSFGDPVLASEHFSLVGPQEMSTFASGSLDGDSGWVVRAELSTTLDAKIGQLPLAASPYVFGAVGSARFHEPDFLELEQTSADAYGIGVDLFTKMDSAFRSGSVRMEYGKGQRDDYFVDEERFSVSGNFRF